MSQKVYDNAIPCMVLTFTKQEIALINETLEASGYEAGDLKNWVLDTMGESESGSEHNGAADRVINNVADFVSDNPETIEAVSRLAGSFVNNIIRKATKKGPQ